MCSLVDIRPTRRRELVHRQAVICAAASALEARSRFGGPGSKPQANITATWHQFHNNGFIVDSSILMTYSPRKAEEQAVGRVSVGSENVSNMVNDRLVPLFLGLGSTAALVKALNTSTKDQGESGTIHANRVHALLSGDPTRAINSATLQLIGSAAEALITDKKLLERAEAARVGLREEATRLHLFSDASVSDIAQRLGVPLAVAGHLLREEQALVASEWAPPQVGHPPKGAPDWGFQDVAVTRCLEALSRGPSPRVGLVLPTGAGKTRTALRIILARLRATSTSDAPALWVTHRKNLRGQAYRELQKLIASGELTPSDLALAARIKFVMVGSLADNLELAQPVLIVIDEAHHAAAESYQPAFNNLPPAPVLLLTATPNRTDGLPIGIDEVAFTITYRELAERGAVLIPEFLDFPVENFDWSSIAIDDLADFVLERCKTTFAKVLVLAPRIDRVHEFHDAIVRRLPADHPLELGDLGFIHGSGNSLGIDNEDFLERFAQKPQAVLVSAQLLLEGFDDPTIDTVIITYPSSSMVRLMQAAGRCVRYSPGKQAAYVVQARNDNIAYHFDHRWLYQEISDFLRPEVIDVDYGSAKDLLDAVRSALAGHNVSNETTSAVIARVAALLPGESCRLFFYGFPHFGKAADFATESKWGVILETHENSSAVRTIFNEFCARGADASDPSLFLEQAGTAFGISKNIASNTPWRNLVGLLTAAYFAKCEVHGPATPLADDRPYTRSSATTWLKYFTYVYRPVIPGELVSFLEDCHNKDAIASDFAASPALFSAAVKVPLPLGGSEAFLLNATDQMVLNGIVDDLRTRLTSTPPQDQVSALAAYLAGISIAISPRLLLRLEFLLSAAARSERFLQLTVS